MAKHTILVIEDNPLNIKLVRGLLQLNGCRVIEAEDARKGIQLAKEQRPDLILMDIHLPGLDGVSAMKIIKDEQDLSRIPVIALTAHAMQGDEQRFLDEGCSAYISKPIDTRSFWEKISQFLDAEHEDSTSISGARSSYRNRILIVDDEPVNVKLLSAQLSNNRYEILTANSGQEAIEVAASENPDVILMDIMMPDMDGYEATERLKRDSVTKDIPVIIVTALDGSEDKIKGFEIGAEEFLTKPVNTIELVARIKSMLRLKQYKELLQSRLESQHSMEHGNIITSPEDRKQTPHILLVEDSEKDGKLIKNYISDDTYRVTWAKSGSEALHYALNHKVDLILLDILLPDMDGFDLCHRFKEMDETRGAQLVVITCLSDLDNRIKGIELGIDDYLVKPINSKELRTRIKVLLKKKDYVDRLQASYQAALNSATVDSLTGLYNRAYFKRYLKLETNRSSRYNYPIALCMIDIDDFKRCNDMFGHVVGDEVLREFSYIIRKNIRETDIAARYGGEEFSVILPYADSEDAIIVAERIRTAMHAYPFEEKVQQFRGNLTVSIGLAIYPIDSSDYEELIRKADHMLYKAKAEGKNRLCLFSRYPTN